MRSFALCQRCSVELMVDSEIVGNAILIESGEDRDFNVTGINHGHDLIGFQESGEVFLL